jgi:hypothetical protein
VGLQKGTRSKNDTITAFRSVPEQIVAGVSIVQNFFRALTRRRPMQLFSATNGVR